jgi:cytidine deaminase
MKMAIVIRYRVACAEIIIMWRVFYKGNGDLKKARILSFGVNQMGDSDGKKPGIHAEYDALSKLMPMRRKRKLESINLLVIRLSSKNKIQSSKPCFNCIETMKKLPPKIGYKIDNVYYSDSDGNITKTNLNTLDKEEKHYSNYFRRKLSK